MAGENWLTGWSYRKSHVLNQNANGGINHQVKIIVRRKTGTDLNQTVFVGTKAKSDFGDIRFTGSDGSTLLNYWLENTKKIDDDVLNSKYEGNPIIDNIAYWFLKPFRDTDGTVYAYYMKLNGSYYEIWAKHSANGKTDWVDDGVILTYGPSTYDSHGVYCCTIWKEGSTYYMLYTGKNASGVNTFNVATSTVSPVSGWTKYGSNPVFTFQSGQWGYPDGELWGLIKVGGTYYMWFNDVGSTHRGCGLITATNIYGPWTLDANNPIFSSSTTIQYHGRYIADIMKKDGIYYLALTYWADDGEICQELYKCSTPTFYSGDRTYIGKCWQGKQSSWEQNEIDCGAFLTDINGNAYEDENGVWYYVGSKVYGTPDTFGWGLSYRAIDDAEFWVELADDISAGNVTIYTYYGKADASTTSNFLNTLLTPSDDFNDGSFDTSKWASVIQTGDTLSETENSGVLTIKCPHAAWHHARFRSINTVENAYRRWYVKAKVKTMAGEQIIEIICSDAALTTGYWGVFIGGTLGVNAGRIVVSTRQSGVWSNRWYSPVGVIKNDTYYIFEIQSSATQIRVFVRDEKGNNLTNTGWINFDDADVYIIPNGIGYGNATPSQNWTDFAAFMRCPDLTHGAWGAEEGMWELTITCALKSVSIKVNGASQSTPYSSIFREETVSLEFIESEPMQLPQTDLANYWKHYYFHDWGDGDTNKTKNVFMNENKTFAIVTEEKYVTPYEQDIKEEDFNKTIMMTMPAEHSNRDFQKWQEDEDTNRIKSFQISKDGEVWTALYPALAVNISPLSGVINVGESITLTASAYGGKKPYSYQWYRDGSPITGATDSTYLFSPSLDGEYVIYVIVTDSVLVEITSDNSLILAKTISGTLPIPQKRRSYFTIHSIVIGRFGITKTEEVYIRSRFIFFINQTVASLNRKLGGKIDGTVATVVGKLGMKLSKDAKLSRLLRLLTDETVQVVGKFGISKSEEATVKGRLATQKEILRRLKRILRKMDEE